MRHGGYDIRSADRGHNVTLPRDAMAEAKAVGIIGEFAETMYSFMGICARDQLRRYALPNWIEELQAAELDPVLLVSV